MSEGGGGGTGGSKEHMRLGCSSQPQRTQYLASHAAAGHCMGGGPPAVTHLYAAKQTSPDHLYFAHRIVNKICQIHATLPGFPQNTDT